MDGWTNKQTQKLNLPDPLPLIFEPRRLSKVCLKLLPAGKLQVSVKKHQYLDGYIFFPNAHNILHPDNIYGLSSEITNWICHPAHRENVWRMVPHYSHRKVIAHSPNLYRRDSENTNGTGRNNVPAVTPVFLMHLPLGQSYLHLNWTCVKISSLCTAGYKQRSSRKEVGLQKLILIFRGLPFSLTPRFWSHPSLVPLRPRAHSLWGAGPALGEMQR